MKEVIVMKKQYHGKYYYVEYIKYDTAKKILNFINCQKEFDEGEFRIVDDFMCIVSKTPVPGFRGPQYQAWQRVKTYVQKLHKEGWW
jgi:hypothetical protein